MPEHLRVTLLKIVDNASSIPTGDPGSICMREDKERTKRKKSGRIQERKKERVKGRGIFLLCLFCA